MRKTTPAPVRFWAKVNKAGPEGFHSVTGEPLGPCWVWTASTTTFGYGKFGREDGGGWMAAHRWAFQDAGLSVPDGHELDHLCRVPSCVNPRHLEAVTHAENVARGNAREAALAWSASITHCPRGHAYLPDCVTIRPDGARWRYCRACKTEVSRTAEAKAKAIARRVEKARLRPQLSRSERALRGRGPEVTRARMAAITHCPSGHAYDEANTYVFIDKRDGSASRKCRACHAAREAAKRARRRV